MNEELKTKTSLWVLALLCLLPSAFCIPSRAATQFTAGYTFSDNTNSAASVITSNRLRLLIENAVINPLALSAQTNLVVSPGTNDTLLLWRAVNSNLAEVPISLLLPTNLFASGLDGGGGAAASLRLDTNLLSLNGTNQITFSLTIATNASPTNGDYFLVFSTNFGNWTRVALAGYLDWITNNAPRTTNTATYTGTNRPVAVNLLHTNAHGLGGMPTLLQWRLVCVTNDQGYLAGEELTSVGGLNNPGGPLLSEWADATNLYVKLASYTLFILHRTSGDHQPLTTNNWRLKPYAIRVNP